MFKEASRLRQGVKRSPAIVACLALAGCSSVAAPPSIPLFGSYFPAWIFCAAGGAVAAILLRALFIRVGLDDVLPAPPLVYLASAVSAGIGLWFLWAGML